MHSILGWVPAEAEKKRGPFKPDVVAHLWSEHLRGGSRRIFHSKQDSVTCRVTLRSEVHSGTLSQKVKAGECTSSVECWPSMTEHRKKKQNQKVTNKTYIYGETEAQRFSFICPRCTASQSQNIGIHISMNMKPLLFSFCYLEKIHFFKDQVSLNLNPASVSRVLGLQAWASAPVLRMLQNL